MKQKQTKSQRIAELERQLMEIQAASVHNYHFTDVGLGKAGTKSLMGSGVIITLTALSGVKLVEPTLIRDGLSDETIKALRDDLVRSYQLATLFKPRGLPEGAGASK